jgi:isoquinoline 1-oxidoreductase beta subunit
MLPRTLPAPDLRPTRRGLLLGAAAAGAGLAVGVPALRARPAAAASGAPYEGYVHIATDGTVTVRSAHMDMGQGIYTGLATLVAEELDADWSKVTAVGAAGNPALYGNLAWGGAVQGTGGSTGMASSWERYRRAGATARAMLVAAAAARWGVPADGIEVRDGVVRHAASGRSAGFGELADEAARQAPPADVRLKDRAEWRLIGSEGLRRYDGRAKATGTETFTIDVRLPGMLTAVVAHPPRFGATVASVDDAAARAVPGVVDVVRISRGVAVVARDTWSAMRGREALTVAWDESRAETRGSDEILAEYRRIAEGPGELTAADRGDAAGGIARAARVIDATFEFPYLAHAALEPLNAVARMQDGRLEVWAGHQIPDVYAMIAAGIAGIPPERATMHVMKTGGGFGRRAVPDGDVVAEAVEVAKAIGWRAPVKVQWTREDDMRGGRYRPLTLHRVRVGLDERGRILGWHHRIVGQPILLGTPFEAMVPPSGIDPTVVEGVADTPYALPDFRLEVTQTRVGVPTLWWRSVGHTHTAYVMECMVDEIAAAAGRDPVDLRRELLAGHPRHRRPPGRRGARELRQRGRARGRGLRRARIRPGAPHRLGDRLRHGGEPGHDPRPGRGRRRLRPRGGAARGADAHRRRGGPGQLRRLPAAADGGDAEGGGAHRAVRRAADRRGRAGRAPGRARGGERAGRRHRPAHPAPSLRPADGGLRRRTRGVRTAGPRRRALPRLGRRRAGRRAG